MNNFRMTYLHYKVMQTGTGCAGEPLDAVNFGSTQLPLVLFLLNSSARYATVTCRKAGTSAYCRETISWHQSPDWVWTQKSTICNSVWSQKLLHNSYSWCYGIYCLKTAPVLDNRCKLSLHHVVTSVTLAMSLVKRE